MRPVLAAALLLGLMGCPPARSGPAGGAGGPARRRTVPGQPGMGGPNGAGPGAGAGGPDGGNAGGPPPPERSKAARPEGGAPRMAHPAPTGRRSPAPTAPPWARRPAPEGGAEAARRRDASGHRPARGQRQRDGLLRGHRAGGERRGPFLGCARGVGQTKSSATR